MQAEQFEKNNKYPFYAEHGKAKGRLGEFDFWDTDKDGYINVQEV